MLFNSIDFAIFLPIVFVLYWFVTNKNLKLQNLLIVIASYLFYGWWDWRFLFLIFFSSIVDFTIGNLLGKEKGPKKRKYLLWISLSINLGLLGFFKYYNFFVDSFVDAYTLFGGQIDSRTLNIILPVGISFYTFQTLSYSIDIYRNNLKPTNDFIIFSAFVSFFPQLVAGPIERASNLLPQFYKKRVFDNEKAVDGMRQILWGLFKKMVVADNLSLLVEPIFSNSESMSTSVLLSGLAFFSVQIYCDFSGYSDIAIGTSKLFGFELKTNFKYPLFARSIGERWRNWHISLSTWFRDYIYIPMGGSRGSKLNKFKNTLILFTISGFWHGANWTFILWGIVNGLMFAPSMLLNTNRKHREPINPNKFFPTLKEAGQIFITFWLITFTYIFFRADNISHSKLYFFSILNNHNFQNTVRFCLAHKEELMLNVFFILIMYFIEWINRTKQHALQNFLTEKSAIIRWSFYTLIVIFITVFRGDQETFIYFQF